MKNAWRISWLVAVTVGALFALSCGDDTVKPKTGCDVCPVFQDLSQKSHVLNNFELAHNKLDAAHYDAVIDDNFTLFYTDQSAGGAGTPVQWGRDTDIAATHTMFASVDQLQFDLDTSSITWAEAPAPGGLETWYSTTLYYHFTVKMGNTTYIPLAGAKMQLTVRNAGTNEAPKWKLVELRDLGGPSLASAVQAEMTGVTTYGQLKALFR